MSIFSSAGNVFAKVVTSIANPISNIIKKGSGTATVKSFQANPVGAVLTKAGSLAIVGGSLVLGGVAVKSAGGISAVASKAVSLLPKSTLGKASIGLLALPVATSVITNPSVIPKSIGAVYDFEKTGIEVASGSKSLMQGAGEFVSEHPIASTLGAVIGLGVVAKTAIPAVTGYLTTQATKENTQALLESGQLPTQNIPQTVPNSFPQDAVNQASGTQTPLQEIPNNAVSRRKRRKSKPREPLRQTINQRVDIDINQNKLTKKYINREILVSR